MPDVSEAEFRVYLQGLHDAIGAVTKEKSTISDELAAVKGNITDLTGYWHSPAFDSFDDVGRWFRRASDDLVSALEDITNRLQTAYDNYERAEKANFQNVNHQLDGPRPRGAA
jgi:WXG100 family type VII secretion target